VSAGAAAPTPATTAIVTGGGRGIGAAIARALTERGVRVTVFARTAAEVERVVAERWAALAVAGDVRREEDVARLVASHARTLGPVGVLVNAAGILERGLAEELTPAAFREVLDVNLVGPFLCARAVIPGMKARGHGRIVNVASNGVFFSISVSPGSTDTEMLKKTPFEPEMSPDDVARVVVFAALDAPDAITGSNLEVYG